MANFQNEKMRTYIAEVKTANFPGMFYSPCRKMKRKRFVLNFKFPIGGIRVDSNGSFWALKSCQDLLISFNSYNL